MKVIALIPAYNEENTIAKVIVKTSKYVDKIIVFDDGSTDSTGEIATKLNVEVIRSERNFGKGYALAELFKKAMQYSADIIVTLDADMQHDPDQIPLLVKTLIENDADIVIGSRFLNESYSKLPGYRKIGNMILNFVTSNLITDTQCGFRAYKKSAIKDLIPAEMGYSADSEIIMKALDRKLKIIEVPIKVRYDVPKPSKNNPIYHGLDALLGIVKQLVIRHPLIFLGIPSLVFFAIALIFGLEAISFFNTYRQMPTNYLVIGGVSLLISVVLATAAIIIYILVSLIREIKK